MSPARRPGTVLLVAAQPAQASIHQKILQRRGDADHDRSDLGDPLAAAVERRHADEIQNKNNDEKRYQDADKHCCFSKIDRKISRPRFQRRKRRRDIWRARQFRQGLKVPSKGAQHTADPAKGGLVALASRAFHAWTNHLDCPSLPGLTRHSINSELDAPVEPAHDASVRIDFRNRKPL
jgi:hypothetical protein